MSADPAMTDAPAHCGADNRIEIGDAGAAVISVDTDAFGPCANLVIGDGLDDEVEDLLTMANGIAVAGHDAAQRQRLLAMMRHGIAS